jgi:type IV pilus assembly protein PilC
MKFSYKALKDDGESYQSTATAESKQALYNRLKEDGETLISAKKSADNKPWYKQDIGFLTNLGAEDKILFARNMSAMLDAGLSVTRALGVMKRQSDDEHYKEIITSIRSNIRQGKSLTDGLKQFSDEFSPLFIYMVEAGEESGSLGEAMAEVADQLERAHELKKKIRGAMIYPAVIVTAMLIVGILMMVYIVPSLTQTFEQMDVDLPATTQFVIAVSDFLQNYTFVALGSLVGLVVAAYYGLQTKLGKRFFDWGVLKIPLIGHLVKETNAARTANTLSSLLASGVEVTRSIEITQDVVRHTYYTEILEELKKEITSGGSMADIFQKYEYYYPAFVGEMVAVGEETGKVDEMLNRIATYYEKDVKQQTDDMSTIVEPVLMIVIGAAVGFFAISMITPMYSLTSSI